MSSSNVSGTRNLPINREPSGPVEPKYSIIHRGHFDIQHFTNAPDSMPTTRPQELVVKIQLPLLKSIATVQLDVFEKQIVLECQKPVSYKLDLPLPYPVDDEKGSAKFDKSKTCLSITLPVRPPKIPKLPSFAPESEKIQLIEEIPSKSYVTEEPQEALPKPAEGTSVGDDVNTEEVTQASVSTNGEDPNNVVDKSRTCSGSNRKGEQSQTEKNEIQESHLSQEKCSVKRLANCENTVPKDEPSLSTTQAKMMMSDDERCPTYIFRQDDATMSVIIQVASIDMKNIQKQISQDGSTVSLKFRSLENVNGATYKCGWRCFLFLFK